MNIKQRNLAFREAYNHYTDMDEFVSDILTSAEFSPVDDNDPDLRMEEIDNLRMLFQVARAPFKEFLTMLALNSRELAERCCIPLRTVQSWVYGERECPPYLRLMIAELNGITFDANSDPAKQYWIVDETGTDTFVDPAGKDRRKAVEQAYEKWMANGKQTRGEYLRRMNGMDLYILYGPADPEDPAMVDFDKTTDSIMLEEIFEMINSKDFN